MLRRFAFTVYDKPVPQARPRFARTTTGKVHTYMPKANQEARFMIRGTFLALPEVVADTYAEGDGFKPLQGPLRLTVTAWLPMPKSIPKKRREAALPTTRPDLDNYIKMVEDALIGYAFMDDSQIVYIEARKRYCLDTSVPRWEVMLDEIEEV